MPTILIAESRREMEKLLAPCLRKAGHEVLYAPAQEFVPSLAASADMVVLELPADLARGADMVRQLAGWNKPDILAVLPTGVSDPFAVRTAILRAGAADCLSAPIHVEESLARIETILAVKGYVKKLLTYSAVDMDTGACSYWLFEKRLNEEHTKASRYPMPLSCLLIGVDNLEKLWSQYDPAFVQTVLRQVALIAEKSLRLTDLVARYRGQGSASAEFVVLLPFTTPTDALVCAERIRGRSEVFPFRQKSATANVTVSVGIAGYSPKRTPDASSLLREAQVCLDFARRQGGNQVVADELYVPKSVQVDSSYEKLLEGVRSGGELAQMKAFHALREAGQEALPVLLQALKDPAAHVRHYSVWLLGAIAAKDAAQAVLPLLKDADQDVRAVAAWTLGRIGDRGAIPALLEAATDTDAQTRNAAALSLSVLSGGALKPDVSGPSEEIKAEVEKCRNLWNIRR